MEKADVFLPWGMYTIVNVHLPKDRVTMQHQGYGFCEFATEEDADYAIKIMNMIKLFGKPIRVNKVLGFDIPYLKTRWLRFFWKIGWMIVFSLRETNWTC
jgi:hypothetical protein